MRIVDIFKRDAGSEISELWSMQDGPLETQCWIWSKATQTQGYGNLWDGERYLRAHRFAYELMYGDIGGGLLICHRCDNPSCVNPHHLFAGTQVDNIRDMDAKGRANRPDSKRENNGNAKLTWSDVREIRRIGRSVSQSVLAEMFSIDQTQVSRILLHQQWKEA